MGIFRNPPGSLAPLRLQLCPASACPANSKDRPGLLSCPDASPTPGVACPSSGSSMASPRSVKPAGGAGEAASDPDREAGLDQHRVRSPLPFSWRVPSIS